MSSKHNPVKCESRVSVRSRGRETDDLLGRRIPETYMEVVREISFPNLEIKLPLNDYAKEQMWRVSQTES